MDKGQQDERREQLREQLRELMTDAVNLVNVSDIDDAQAENACLLALIHAHPLNRIANTLGALERIAKALEARGAEGTQLATAPREPATGDPITPSAPDQSVPTEPVASGEHWRTGFPSAEQTCNGWVEVRTGGQPAALPDGRALRVQHRLNIEIGDYWAPMAPVKSFTLRPDSPTTPAEPTVAPSAPQEHPVSDPDTLVLGTSQERHTGGPEALQGEGEAQGASEGAQAGQEGPVAASGGHPLDHGGWIRSRLPAEGDADEKGDVKFPVGNDWFWCSWRIVTPGQPWAPATTKPSPYTPKPLWAHLAYPSSQGWIHDRVPGPEDGDEDGEVVVACQGVWHWDGDPDTTDGPIRASAYAHWSHIVPGQPWRPFT